MRKLIILLVSVVILFAGLFSFIAGCKSKEELSVDDIRDFADPITESMLVAANNGDYIEYSSHFDDTMKAAVSEYSFSGTNTMIKALIGDYVSKEFVRNEKELENIIVYYDAEYTLEPDPVEVKIVFRKIEDEWYVVGLWYNSPALLD